MINIPCASVVAALAIAMAGCSPSGTESGNAPPAPSVAEAPTPVMTAEPTAASTPEPADTPEPGDTTAALPPITPENYAREMERQSREYEAAEYKPATLTGFRCGDNCYVEFVRGLEGAPVEEALCTADICDKWKLGGELPKALRGTGLTMKYGTASQRDASGTIRRRDVPAVLDIRIPGKAGRTSAGPVASNTTGPLPLKRGVYVKAGSDCASPANAFVRIYNGTGLSGSATRACRATVRSRDGNVLKVDQSCENTYDRTRTTEPQTIAVSDAGSFTLGKERFRLCPRGEAPDELERLAR